MELGGAGCVGEYQWAGILGSGCSGCSGCVLVLDQDESIKIPNWPCFSGLLVGNAGNVHWPLIRGLAMEKTVVGAE